MFIYKSQEKQMTFALIFQGVCIFEILESIVFTVTLTVNTNAIKLIIETDCLKS